VRRGPHAEAKWLTGSVACDAKEVIRAAFGQAGARGPAHARTWVVLTGGDRHQIELIQAGAPAGKRRSASSSTSCTCWSYLWGAAWCFHARDNPAAED
jgi:hypothetical protein